jgi:hypothetical protein
MKKQFLYLLPKECKLVLQWISSHILLVGQLLHLIIHLPHPLLQSLG